MTANALKQRIAAPVGKSPTDPQECCDWANERRHVEAVNAGLFWHVTGNPAKPIELR
jgi:hypothetical protein